MFESFDISDIYSIFTTVRRVIEIVIYFINRRNKMRAIRVSDDLYKKLESLAVGFDTPQNVIERLVEKVEGIDTEEIRIKQERGQQSKRIPLNLDVIKQVYLLAKDAFEQKGDRYDVRDTLVKDAGMNPASAMMCVQALFGMMKGECYKRSINGTATEYFLEMILADYGQEALKTALSSVYEHIEYYESHGTGKLHNIRNIHNKFLKLV